MAAGFGDCGAAKAEVADVNYCDYWFFLSRGDLNLELQLLDEQFKF